jgi:small GTP-binding protein
MLYEIKCVFIGDSKVGKTTIINRRLHKFFKNEYEATVFDNYDQYVNLNEKDKVILHIWDTSGSSDYDPIRSLSYKNVDYFIICYDITNPVSFSNISKKYLRDIPDNSEIILVGCKSDLSLSRLKCEIISYDQGYQKSLEIKAKKFLEVSSFNTKNINEIFDYMLYRYNKEKLKKSCKYCIIV